jgi:NADPH2:quinone reductase
MRAVVMRGTGGPEVLELAEVELAWPQGERDVLVRLEAAGVNPADAYFRALGPYVRGEGPCILGHDGAGIVEAVGPRVGRVRRGDRVCFCNGGIGGAPGTYAEYAVVPEAQLVPVPSGVDFVQAAALPLVVITAWESLYDRAGLAAGERVLVHAGAGGTGHVAVQLARLRGARVAATVSSEAKAAFVKGIGVERPIIYRQEDWVSAALAWSGEAGIDVALDNIGGDAIPRLLRAMAPYGRLVTLMGTPADDEEASAYNRNLTIHNVMMLTPMWLGLEKRLAQQAAIVREGIGLVAAGRLELHVAATFPLAEAPAAHRRLEAGGMTGKIVLTIGD